MPIRFEYPVTAGIGGAYAAGLQQGKQRRQKYLLDLYQQEREHQFRMQERMAGRVRGAGVGGGGVAPLGGAGAPGGWVAPVAPPPFDAAGKRKWNTQRRANARARHLGRPIPFPDIEPTFHAAPSAEVAGGGEAPPGGVAVPGGAPPGGVAVPGGWMVDPAKHPLLTKEEKTELLIKQRAQIKDRARQIRLGREPTATDALPVFQLAPSEKEVERGWKDLNREDVQAHALELETSRQQGRAGAARLAGQVELAQDMSKTIEQDIAKNLYSPDDARELRKINHEIRMTLASGRFTDEADRDAALEPLYQKRDALTANRLPERTREDNLREVLGDEVYEKHKGLPWQIEIDKQGNKTAVLPPNFPWEQLPEAQEAERQKQRWDAIRKRTTELLKLTTEDGQTDKYTVEQALEKAIKEQDLFERARAGPQEGPTSPLDMEGIAAPTTAPGESADAAVPSTTPPPMQTFPNPYGGPPTVGGFIPQPGARAPGSLPPMQTFPHPSGGAPTVGGFVPEQAPGWESDVLGRTPAESLPHPATPEEARKLHGTYFITPDGRRLWAP